MKQKKLEERISEIFYEHKVCTAKGQDWFQRFEYTDCKHIINNQLKQLISDCVKEVIGEDENNIDIGDVKQIYMMNDGNISMEEIEDDMRKIFKNRNVLRKEMRQKLKELVG